MVSARRKWQPTPVFLPGKNRLRSLVGYSPWGRKELYMTERLHFHFFTFSWSLQCSRALVTDGNRQGSLLLWGFPGGSVVQNPPANAGDMGLIPGLGRSPGGGNGNLLLCSCLGDPMDREAWQAIVHGVTEESDIT